MKKIVLAIVSFIASFIASYGQSSDELSERVSTFEERYERLSDESKRLYAIDIDSLLQVFNQYVQMSDSLFIEVEHLAYPTESSPFFVRNDKGNMILRDRCSTDSVSLPHQKYLYIFYLLTLSFTHSSDGMGPTLYITDDSLPDKEVLNLNYAQFLAAITWYKINRERVEHDSFAYFCSSIYGENWAKMLKDRASVEWSLHWDINNNGYDDDYFDTTPESYSVSEKIGANSIKLINEILKETIDVNSLFNLSRDNVAAFAYLFNSLMLALPWDYPTVRESVPM